MKSEQALGYDGRPYTVGDRVVQRGSLGVPLGEVVGVNVALGVVLVRSDDPRTLALIHGKPSDFRRAI